MTPQAFIARWKNNALSERAGAQPYFDELCELLDVEKPRDPESYCFERGAKKSGGDDGWADVWKRGCFAWENKKPGRDLKAALKQLTDYFLQLDTPPLLVVCDRQIIEIHTAFTGYPHEVHAIRLDELVDAGKRQQLRWVFVDPEKLRPQKSTAAITQAIAIEFGALAESMRARGEAAQRVAHFLMQSLFCMFAEDEGLLPSQIFSRMLEAAVKNPERAAERIRGLFEAMSEPGGFFGSDDIQWFNGGLFNTVVIPNLTRDDLRSLINAADKDWRAIDPSIFGTLFERGLDPSARAQLGAHYTDPETINKLIGPLVTSLLLAEWEATHKQLVQAMSKAGKKIPKAAIDLYQGFLLRLENFRVLDPACGSGNFLYLALRALRDVEKRVRVEAAELGLQADLAMHTGPHNILGLEINEYAAELARITVWIGDIQWSRQNGYPIAVNPILRPLEGIERRDALLNADGTETEWPKADVIVGNPPFLGDKMMRGELGDAYTDALRQTYTGCVPGGADLVCYWFHKARCQIETGQCEAAGLVATNSIRGGANRAVLDAIVAVRANNYSPLRIFEAWSDEAWVNEDAAVRVSLIGFGNRDGARLNGQSVENIHADLTAVIGLDLTKARRLSENANLAFIGPQKDGPLDVSGKLAREWLKSPNPHGKPNAEVVKPRFNGMDLTRRSSDSWIIDFHKITEADAALYEKPFAHVLQHVKPARDKNRDINRRMNWWRFGRTGEDMRNAMAGLPRFIATSRVAKHRLFVWMNCAFMTDSAAVAIARDDDTTFGILSSRFHELWALRLGTALENRPRYTPTTCFETFPFPEGLTPKDKGENPAIAEAAKRLNELRENWLNPPEWVDWIITPEEEQAGFPARPVAKPGHENDLKKRTLTNLYNQRPAWLDIAHRALDTAVAAAYGWADDTAEMTDEEILRRLLALNIARS